jgi:hypothetical protein
MLVVWIALSLGCSKPAPARQCPEFDQAQKLLDQIADETLDPSFGDPRYEPALRAFEAIAPDCAQHSTAVSVAETIRSAMEKAQAAPPPAPPADVVVTPPPQPRSDAFASDVRDYFEETEADDSQMRKLADEAQKSGDFTAVLAEVDRLESIARAATPPEPCREYHELGLSILAENKAVLEQLRDAIAQKNVEAVKAAAETRAEIKTKEARLQLLKQELEKKYGVR